jgi:hypothetical protein
MGHRSHPDFVTLHALRIKGFAKVDTIAEIVAMPESDVESHLLAFAASGHTMYREQRALWQLTPDGRAHHAELLVDDVQRSGAVPIIAEHYEQFLEINGTFKQLCTDWQLRGGAPNDHSDTDYDRDVLDRLRSLHATAQPVVASIGTAMLRLEPYAPRLASVVERVGSGETNLFTGVMCGSYHDVWMELHEDLILTQGIDRASEGSF